LGAIEPIRLDTKAVAERWLGFLQAVEDFFACSAATQPV
jgi:hypothetical protein